MIIKKFFRILLTLFLLFHAGIAMSNNNIYYLDIDFLMNNSLAGKSILKKLDEKNKSIKKKFQDIEISLKNEEKKIISQKNILSEQEYLNKAQSFTKKVDDYKLLRNKTINDISKLKSKAQENLTNTLTPILAEYAEKNSISFIIPKQSIIIGKTELDLTNTIIEILNSKIKNIKLK